MKRLALFAAALTVAVLAAVPFGAFASSVESSLSVVAFDANGGEMANEVRIVRTGGTYGENVNIYPGDSVDNFSTFSSDALTLSEDGVFTYEYKNQYCNFFSRPIANILPGMSYTYVLDCFCASQFRCHCSSAGQSQLQNTDERRCSPA